MKDIKYDIPNADVSECPVASLLLLMDSFLFLLHLLQVYLPCVLQTKKRYVGYMYESLDQKEPVFDAKGIETVRRDGCPAVSKVTDKPAPPPQFYCVLLES